MKRTAGRAGAARILLCMLLAVCLSAAGCGKAASPEKVMKNAVGYLHAAGGLDDDESLTAAAYYKAGDSLSDWVLITALEAGDDTLDTQKYLQELQAYVEKAYAENGGLDSFRATEWHRTILAVCACGGDPTAFGTGPDGQPIDLVRDGIWDWDRSSSLDEQGSNALIYALLALQASGAEPAADAAWSTDRILARLLSYQADDGGFGLVDASSDNDMTGMALHALGPYADRQVTLEDGTPVTVADSIGRAEDWLAGQQARGGYYLSEKHYSAETLSQIILGLCACGVDPGSDERFRKAGGSAEDALLSFQNKDGGFASTFAGSGDLEESELMPTYQALSALAALRDLRKK